MAQKSEQAQLIKAGHPADGISIDQSKNDEKLRLEEQYKELSFLCMNYDPYSPEADVEITKLLEKYKLTHIEDPFTITNYLLKMLDQCETHMKSLSSGLH